MTPTLIKIDRATQEELAALAVPFLGKRDCANLMRQIGDLLRERFPDRTISVGHVEHEPDLMVPRIRVAVVVDGEFDQGLVFTRPLPSAANDDAPAPLAFAA